MAKQLKVWDGTQWVLAAGTIGPQGVTGPSPSYAISTNAQTAAYTLALSDANKMVEVSNAAAVDLTVPANGTIAFPVGTQINVLQTGAGQVTIKPDAGVTINSRGGALKIAAQWSVATLIKRATDTWVAFGSLTT